jgi:hypothetical protein
MGERAVSPERRLLVIQCADEVRKPHLSGRAGRSLLGCVVFRDLPKSGQFNHLKGTQTLPDPKLGEVEPAPRGPDSNVKGCGNRQRTSRYRRQAVQSFISGRKRPHIDDFGSSRIHLQKPLQPLAKTFKLIAVLRDEARSAWAVLWASFLLA